MILFCSLGSLYSRFSVESRIMTITMLAIAFACLPYAAAGNTLPGPVDLSNSITPTLSMSKTLASGLAIGGTFNTNGELNVQATYEDDACAQPPCVLPQPPTSPAPRASNDTRIASQLVLHAATNRFFMRLQTVAAASS